MAMPEFKRMRLRHDHDHSAAGHIRQFVDDRIAGSHSAARSDPKADR
jgi:hypothetical protein